RFGVIKKWPLSDNLTKGFRDVPCVVEKHLIIRTNNLGMRSVDSIMPILIVITAVRQYAPRVHHKSWWECTARPLPFHHEALFGWVQSPSDIRGDVFCGHSTFETKLACMELRQLWMGKVVDHRRREHQDVGGATGFDKDVDLNLGHISKEAVFILTGNCGQLS